MSTYKFTYFNVEALGETSRYIFAVAGQEYEDIRIEEADWPKMKEGTPLGQLPYLDVDGERIPQSMAINRYLSRKFGLYGENDIEKARIDVVLEVLEELGYHTVKAIYEKDEGVKQTLLKELAEVQAPKYLGLLEKLLVANQGGDGYFVGSKISLADIVVFNWVHDRLPYFKIINKEPRLQALVDKIKALPRMNAWLKKRPKTR
ncbi:Hematopoietic prostaglandin D synthase [Holothuria leucospilota]|uniref:Hematopoietic prostaglandin D synthase n=1 Tax=Holothuria leucospilota TaxID=206669 RepID=A0A9Q0YSI7_HOLLE|nr:Hematopoietic prostaglandin D synthase [Holothuria leucospilota]